MAVFEFTGPGDLAAWMREPGSDAGVVVASRVRLSRNLRTHPYPGTCSAEEDLRLREEILEAIRHLPNAGEFAILYLDELAPLERRILFMEVDALLLMIVYFGGLWLLYARGVTP